MSLARVASRAFNTPLLVDPGKAAAIIAGLGGRLLDGGVQLPAGIAAVDHVAFSSGRPSMGVIGDGVGRRYDARGWPTFDVLDGVAVIPIEGTLVQKGAYIGSMSGETSYEGLQAQVRRAGRSEAVKAVVFEVDSFGGEANGAFETAQMIRELSIAKPTLAVLTDYALSAGYLLASAARQIVMPEFGRAGSIGVLRMHVDYSRKLENEGVKVTFVHAGKDKVAGNQFEPLPAELAAQWQAELQVHWERFAQTVELNRGGRIKAEQIYALEAGHFEGEQSLKFGLVDGVGNSQEAFAAFLDAVKRKG